MKNDPYPWEKRGVEIPPGWHASMKKLSKLTGVGLKYLYALALDRLLSEKDYEQIGEAASVLQRRCRQDLDQVAERHTSEIVEARYKAKKPKPKSAKKTQRKKYP